jgi:elongation factor Ts
MLDSKRALEEAEGDMEEAARLLRVQGLASAAKRSGREATQGAVALGVEGPVATLVELRCETDFVAKSVELLELAQELADLAATKGEAALEERAAAIDELGASLKENISLGTVVRFELAPGSVLGSYLHMQAGRGVNGVLVELAGGSEQLAHDVAVHIAFAKPSYLDQGQVPEAEIAAERATLEELSRNEGKPEAALGKIVDGRMQGWFKERCLLDQAYVKDEKRTVSTLLGAATVVRFAQVVVGG